MGSAVHKGVEVLLKMDQLGLDIRPELSSDIVLAVEAGALPIDLAVQIAIAEFKQAYETHEVDVTINESMQWIQDEHCALIELTLRMWAEHPDGLPWLLKEYEVLEVEQWDVMPLVGGEAMPAYSLEEIWSERKDGLSMATNPPMSELWRPYWKMPLDELWKLVEQGYVVKSGGINLRSRADALLRKRSDGSFYIWSLKTANGWDKRQENANRHDVQGISEMVCVEYRLRRVADDPERAGGLLPTGQVAPRVDGTQMTYLIKGRRELNEKLNVYQIKNGLLHPWAIDAGLLGEKEYAHSYWYKCELPHQKGTTKGGKPIMCEGNANHRLGDSWQQVNIWEQMTIKEWVRMLLDGQVQPSLPLPTVVINPIPYFRNDVEVEDWLEQVVAQERKALEGLQFMNEQPVPPENQDELNRHILNKWFPQHRRSCSYPYPCVMQDICWGPSAIADDPVGSGLYRLRTEVEMEVTEDV
jgi:hypothetical protein